MARFDPERFPDRFEIDRYARRMQQEEISRLTRVVAVGWHRLVRQWTGAAKSAQPMTPRGLRTN